MPNSIGRTVCEIGTGEPCDSLFGLKQKEFFKLAQIPNPVAGDSVVVKLGDPISLFTDNRRLVILLDDDPKRIVQVANQQEGTTAKYDIKNADLVDFVSVWIDENVDDSTVRLLLKKDAEQVVADSEKGVLDKIGESVDKAAEEQATKTRNMLIGAAIFVIVIVGIAAITIPKIKIPKVDVS